MLNLIEGFMPEADWLSDEATLSYLHATVSTRRQRVRVPETPMHLDAILVDEPLTGGLEPRLGSSHLRTLTVMGFPSQTWPGLLDDLNRLAFEYRWVIRAFDDGSQVFIEFPSGIGQGEMPPLWIIESAGDAQLVNYRIRGRFMIVDRLFGGSELRLGGNSQRRVRIVRTDGRRR